MFSSSRTFHQEHFGLRKKQDKLLQQHPDNVNGFKSIHKLDFNQTDTKHTQF